MVSFVSLLSHLVAKDFLDFSDEPEPTGCASAAQLAAVQAVAAQEAKDVAAQASAVVFFGLQQLLPLVTPQLLQFPSLASRLFVLIGFMVEVGVRACLLARQLLLRRLLRLLLQPAYAQSLLLFAHDHSLASAPCRCTQRSCVTWTLHCSAR